jgi:hypothetical protein
MDYKKIYNQIIEKAQNRVLKSYTERHHIIPKCMGGDLKKDNLVRLTAKEHFICHMLLIRIYPHIPKLKHALWMMINGAGGRKRYCPSSRTYESIRKEHSIIVGLRMSKLKLGIPLSEDHKLNIGKALKGRKVSQKCIEFASKPKTKTQIKKRVEKIKKPILQYDKNGNFIREWESQTDACRILNLPSGGTLNKALKQKIKSYKGFIWEYK